jgi:hypothetical protein
MSEQMKSWTASVSFIKTPLNEISDKAREIAALGWEESSLGDPWAVAYTKDLPEGTTDPEAELRNVMRDYWVTAEEIKAILAR